jgi:hypothetical protein
VHVVSLNVFDAVLLCTHFAVVCIVVHQSLVPPAVPADSIGACSQLEYVRCLCAVYAVSSSVSAVHRSATPTGAASSVC